MGRPIRDAQALVLNGDFVPLAVLRCRGSGVGRPAGASGSGASPGVRSTSWQASRASAARAACTFMVELPGFMVQLTGGSAAIPPPAVPL